MLHPDPKQRPTALEVASDPILNTLTDEPEELNSRIQILEKRVMEEKKRADELQKRIDSLNLTISHP